MGADAVTRRLFVAIPVPSEPAAAFRSVLQTLADRGTRTVPVERLHLTLVFMAAVPEPQVEHVVAVVGRAADATPAFELATTGIIDRFGARVAWAGLRGTDVAAVLADRLRGAVVRCSVDVPDRPFRAHLTLARAGRRRITPTVVADLSAPRVQWQVDRLVLIDSVLGRGPAQWRRLADCPLRGSAGAEQ